MDREGMFWQRVFEAHEYLTKVKDGEVFIHAVEYVSEIADMLALAVKHARPKRARPSTGYRRHS